jgi:hypothetical protein
MALSCKYGCVYGHFLELVISLFQCVIQELGIFSTESKSCYIKDIRIGGSSTWGKSFRPFP